MQLIGNCVHEFVQTRRQIDQGQERNKLIISHQKKLNGQYRNEEKNLKYIIHRPLKPLSDENKIELIIYYRTIRN